MSRSASQRTVHVRIEGRVQGVYYRGWTAENARATGLSGYVRNCRDGAVEAVFSGDAEAVSQMLRRCEDGPLDAEVSSVRILQEGGTVADGFIILPTT